MVLFTGDPLSTSLSLKPYESETLFGLVNRHFLQSKLDLLFEEIPIQIIKASVRTLTPIPILMVIGL